MELPKTSPVSAGTRFRKKSIISGRDLDETYRYFSNNQCKACKKILSSKQNLKEHMFIHSGERPYVCKAPGCGITFRQGSQLSAHKRIHINQEKDLITSVETIYLKVNDT